VGKIFEKIDFLELKIEKIRIMTNHIEHRKGEQPNFEELCNEQMNLIMGDGDGMYEEDHPDLPYIRGRKSWQANKMEFKTNERADKTKGLAKQYARKKQKRGDRRNYPIHDCHA
jgi:hypothetical protein